MQLSTQRIKKQAGRDNLVYTGKKYKEEVHINLINYDDKSYMRKNLDDLAHICDVADMKGIKWINIDGIHDVDVIESIGMQFGVHFLVLEDIVEVNQRPKMEDYDTHVFFVMKMLYLDKAEEKIVSEQISMLLMKDTLITFQERPGDVFDTIRNKILNNKGRIRKLGADYLCYSLMDAIVDHYFLILEDMGEEIAVMEKSILQNPSSDLLEDIYNLKMDIIFLRKAVVPLREMIMKLMKEESDLIEDYLVPYAKDLYDHVVQVIETLKTDSDTLSGILDIYSSSVNNQTSKTMQRLTMITIIFMPLTFLSGVGGMSEFTMMTGGERNWPRAYLFFMMAMVVIGFIFWLFIRRVSRRN